MKRYVDFLEKVKQYCYERIIIWGAGVNGRQIKKLLEVAEIDVHYMVDTRHDLSKGIYDPEVLKKEDKSRCLVIVSPHHIPYIKQIDSLLEEWGYTKDRNYINFVSDEEIQENSLITYFDPLLGYSKIGNIEGFKISGNVSSKNVIVILGNCTSLQNNLRKSWINFFIENLSIEYGSDYVVYNGAEAGYSSSQELLKFIRDTLILKPKVLVILDGVIDAVNNNVVKNHPYYTRFGISVLEEWVRKYGTNMKYKNMQMVPEKVLYGMENRENSCLTYIKNIRMLHAITSEFGIEIYLFFQPSLYFENQNVLEGEEKKIFDLFYGCGDPVYYGAHQFYLDVFHNMTDYSWFYDLTKIFQQTNESVYLDEIHYTEHGNFLLGQYISNTILRKNE